MKTPKTLIVILSLDREPWRSLENAQRATWAVERPDVEILYLRGRASGLRRAAFLALRRACAPLGLTQSLDRAILRAAATRQVRRNGNVLLTQVPETWIGTSAKTWAGLRYAVASYRFDYLLRTNSSTYVDISRMQAYLSGVPEKEFYGGFLVGEGEDLHAYGTGVLVSRDLAESMVKDAHWDFDIVDDRAMGRAALRCGIVPTFVPRVDFRSEDELRAMKREDLDQAFMYRCKVRGDRALDLESIGKIHSLLTTVPYRPQDETSRSRPQ